MSLGPYHHDFEFGGFWERHKISTVDWAYATDLQQVEMEQPKEVIPQE